MRVNKLSGLCAAGFVIGALCLPADRAAAQDWDWMVTPYLWGTTTSADLYINDNQVIFGYRHLVLEFKDTTSIGNETIDSEFDLTMSGPAVGFAFNF